MRHKDKGFSLIELLIVVAIILIIASIAIPNLMRAKMSANESSAAASVRSINTGEVSYASAYPGVGYTTLASLGGASPCTPSTTSACFVDNVLAGGTKEGYSFSAVGGTPANGVNTTYTSLGSPLSVNQTGTRSFCSDQTGVIYYTVNSTACTTGSGSVLQ
jgi:type IV pilus assembly protein PilA